MNAVNNPWIEPHWRAPVVAMEVDSGSDTDSTDEEDDAYEFSPFDANRAADQPFPPGCYVMIVRSRDQSANDNLQQDFQALYGQVTAVGVGRDPTDGSNLNTLYKVSMTDNFNSIEGNRGNSDSGDDDEKFFRLQELQFAPYYTPLWLWSEKNNDMEMQEAIILGSEHLPRPNEDPVASNHTRSLVYSVQTLDGTIHSNVTPNKVWYRSSDGPRPPPPSRSLPAETAPTQKEETPPEPLWQAEHEAAPANPEEARETGQTQIIEPKSSKVEKRSQQDDDETKAAQAQSGNHQLPSSSSSVGSKVNQNAPVLPPPKEVIRQVSGMTEDQSVSSIQSSCDTPVTRNRNMRPPDRITSPKAQRGYAICASREINGRSGMPSEMVCSNTKPPALDKASSESANSKGSKEGGSLTEPMLLSGGEQSKEKAPAAVTPCLKKEKDRSMQRAETRAHDQEDGELKAEGSFARNLSRKRLDLQMVGMDEVEETSTSASRRGMVPQETDKEDGELSPEQCSAKLASPSKGIPAQRSAGQAHYKNVGEQSRGATVVALSTLEKAPAGCSDKPGTWSRSSSGDDATKGDLTASLMVENRKPNPFQIIKFGANINEERVFREIRADRERRGLVTRKQIFGGIGQFLFNRCLRWHIQGNCIADCKMHMDHVRLSPDMTQIFEDELRPAIDKGLIATVEGKAQQTAAGQNAAGAAYAATEYTLRHNENPLLEPAGWASKVKVPVFDGTFKIPCCYGLDFVKQAILGTDRSIGQELADKYFCTIQLVEATKGTGKPFVVQLRSTSKSCLEECCFALESTLLDAAPTKLRPHLLVMLSTMNKHHWNKKSVVRTGGPTNATQYLSVTYAGHTPNEERRLVALADVKEWKNSLQNLFPNCTVDVMEKSSWQGFPKIGSHVVISGPSFDDVYNCRDKLQMWSWGKQYNPSHRQQQRCYYGP